MKKIISAVALTIGALALAAPAQAVEPPPASDAQFGVNPDSNSVPLDFGPGTAPGNGASVLGNWDGNAGHATLPDTAQLTPGQHDVLNRR